MRRNLAGWARASRPRCAPRAGNWSRAARIPARRRKPPRWRGLATRSPLPPGARYAAVPAHHGNPRSGGGPTQGRGAVTGWSQSMAPPRDASGLGRQDTSTRAAAGHGSSAYRVDQGSQRGGSGRSQPVRPSDPVLRDPPDGRALRSQGSQRSAVHRGQASQPALADTPQQLICCAPKWTCTPSAHGSTTPASTRRLPTHSSISRRRRKQSPPLARMSVPQSDMLWKVDAEGMAHLGTL